MNIMRWLRVAVLGLALWPAAAWADEAAALRQALALTAAKDWPAATVAATGAGAVGADIIEWQRLRAGAVEGGALLGDYERFLARRPDWPGLALVREKGEVAVARSTDPARVLAYFAAQPPRSGAGAVALVRAQMAQGQNGGAEALRAWVALAFTVDDEAAMLAMQPGLQAAHQQRLDRILWATSSSDRGRVAEAERMLPRVSEGWRALAVARLALATDRAGVSALVDAVPKDLAGDAGLAYARFDWRMRKDRYDDATALIIARSGSAAALGDPQLWAERRALLARRLIRLDRPREAYAVAAGHQLQAGTDYADLEFVAGFVALRKLGDAGRALQHFERLKAAVATPISLARADYWIGRAREAAGDAAEAKAAFRRAARYQTAFYGLMAAEKLGLPLDTALLSEARPADWRGAEFAGSSVLAAARLLLAAGDRTLAKRFALQLAEGLDGVELDQLADMALAMGEAHIALVIGKAAAERGLILPRAYYPLSDMVPEALPVSRALALAIARRESEFDPAAQSPVGARGLMQVMPATAQAVSKRLGLDYRLAKLTGDPAYNVVLGAQYLRQLADEFGPALALIAAGYNAGPGRPRQWITDFGDPRRADVDVVDWIETIPFAETRTYVMRVVEGVVIYRAKLKGAVGPVRITAELKG